MKMKKTETKAFATQPIDNSFCGDVVTWALITGKLFQVAVYGQSETNIQVRMECIQVLNPIDLRSTEL